MTLLKCVFIYWLIAIAAIYYLHNSKHVNRKGKLLYKGVHLVEEKPSLWERIRKHLFLVLVMPWLLPFGIPSCFQILYNRIFKSKRKKLCCFNCTLYGLRIFYNDMPVKDTKYIRDLSNYITVTVDVRPLTDSSMGPCSVKQIAQDSNWLLLKVLKRDHYSQFEQVKLCYQAAVDDGIYEAANNLGILAYEVEDNIEESLKQLNFAASHGSQNAMINMFSIYWNNEDYGKAIKLLKGMPQKKTPSLKCLWNLSALLYYGEFYPHNTIKKDNQKAMNILNSIIDYNRDCICENEKNVPPKAKEFLEYIECLSKDRRK